MPAIDVDLHQAESALTTISIASTTNLRIDQDPGAAVVPATEQSALPVDGVEDVGTRKCECDHAGIWRSHLYPAFSTVVAAKKSLVGDGVKVIGMSRIVSDSVSFGPELSGIRPEAKAIHGPPNALRRGGEQPAGLHASGHIRMDQLSYAALRATIHQTPALPGVLTAVNPMIRHDDVDGLRLSGMRRNGDNFSAG